MGVLAFQQAVAAGSRGGIRTGKTVNCSPVTQGAGFRTLPQRLSGRKAPLSVSHPVASELATIHGQAYQLRGRFSRPAA